MCVRSKLKLKTELFLEKWKTFYIIDPANSNKNQQQYKTKFIKTHKQTHTLRHNKKKKRQHHNPPNVL